MSEAPAIHNSSVRYSSYTPAQKRATQKYRANNKDKVNEQRKAYYESRKEADPEFLAYKREKAKEYYQRKKTAVAIVPEVLMPESDAPLDVQVSEPAIESDPIVPESIIDAIPEVIADVPVEQATAKVKKPRAPRKKAVKPDAVSSLEVPLEIEVETVVIPATPKPSKPRGKTIFIPPVVQVVEIVEESKEELPIV
jgi:hypothetical protein